MNPVAIYHFFKKYFLFVLLSMIKWRFQGRAAVERWQKTLASRFLCCKEYSQFAPYLAFSILAFFKGIRISIPQLWIAKISRRPKCAFLIWWWGLFWNLVVDFQQSKQKVKTSFLALACNFLWFFRKSQQNWLKKSQFCVKIEIDFFFSNNQIGLAWLNHKSLYHR